MGCCKLRLAAAGRLLCPQGTAGKALLGDLAPVWGGFDAGEGPAKATRGFGVGIGMPGYGGLV